ncbi:MAG: hypothetical protein K9J13_08975 [Saprospiraceae bacterium]|nr:hypothetical protein [Saprospiraceae bacterium]
MKANTLKVIDFINKSNVAKWHSFLRKSQWWSKTEIENYQNEKLRELIKHAYNNVPYYNSLFKEIKITPSDINNSSDLHKIPVLTKDLIKNNFNDLIAKNAKSFHPIRRKTGGTTGVPLVHYSDKNSWSIGEALKYRAFEWGGYKLGERMALIGGSSILPDDSQGILKKIWNYYKGVYPLSAITTGNKELTEYLKVFENKRINYIKGYPNGINNFADYLNKVSKNININAVFVTAEYLDDYVRENISKVFNTDVYNQYGAADAGINASECRHHTGMHVGFESCIVEILEDNYLPSNIGEITCTQLTNFAMPKIRYQPNDVVAWIDEKCECGRELSMIDIIGRSTNLVFSNGRKMPGKSIPMIMRNFPVLKFQIVQDSPKSIIIHIDKESSYKDFHTKKIIEAFSYHIGSEIDIKINFGIDFDSLGSNKYRYIVSYND